MAERTPPLFVDHARIFVKAGRGGDGCVSFRREKYVPYGGPDGGNGGRGGDVFLEADPRMRSLLDLTYKPHYTAESGHAGQGSNKAGKSGQDLVIHVPYGTVLYAAGQPLADLQTAWQRVQVAHGGRGGRGNASFKTSRNRAPRLSQRGEPGEEITLDMDLKLLAEVGLVGCPNAGKSTLLSRLTGAKPKIAPYPFTTLRPYLGVVRRGDASFVLADIPGLIEGAHEGKGLGDDFLKHIERTRVLIHLVDLFGYGDKTAEQNVRLIQKELEQFSKRLVGKPTVVVGNKMDLPDAEKKFKTLKSRFRRFPVLAISAVTGEGLRDLVSTCFRLLAKAPEEEPVQASETAFRFVVEPEFRLERDGRMFVVKGQKVERLVAMTNFNQDEGVRRLQGILKKMGVEKELSRQGARAGDTVRLGEMEFSYEPE